MLVIRHLFGFEGQLLVADAVSTSCKRCSAGAIKGYLNGLGDTLDIDGNGHAGSLSDGMLLLRYLFGIADPTLTENAVAADCTRCDGAAIMEYLAPLTGP